MLHRFWPEIQGQGNDRKTIRELIVSHHISAELKDLANTYAETQLGDEGKADVFEKFVERLMDGNEDKLYRVVPRNRFR